MITSKTNELIKYIKSLHLKKERDAKKVFIVEGKKMVAEALDAKLPIEHIIICEELFNEEINTSNYTTTFVSKSIFEYITDTKTPQGILAVVKQKEHKKVYENTIFALDNVQDPGNLGTIIRTLDCAGINTLILSEGCADSYNSKVIRSTMGAIYRVNIFANINLKEELIELKKQGYDIVVTSLDANSDLFSYNFKEKSVVIIGNESNGVSKEIQELANEKIIIPMCGKTESLNAGVAASLIAYEIYRKRKN